MQPSRLKTIVVSKLELLTSGTKELRNSGLGKVSLSDTHSVTEFNNNHYVFVYLWVAY
jgi:hypothetical protein